MKSASEKHRSSEKKTYKKKYSIVDNAINVIVIELTNKCDLNCVFCPKAHEEYSLKYRILKKVINENKNLRNPVRTFELGGMGNPLLHKNIKDVLELFVENGLTANVVTNGFNLKDTIAFFDDSLLQNVNFSVYLDSPDEKRNDYLMGKKTFKKTLESLEYLIERGFRYDIMMRSTSLNYDEIEDMLELSNHYRCNLLLPIEIFPLGKANNETILDDEKKKIVVKTIENLRELGLPVFKCIHFENPSGNCTYLRLKRLFINSKGSVSFCHFLSSLSNTRILNVDNKNLSKLIEETNRVYSNFVKLKEEKLKSWELPRMTASPCSYCIQSFGVKHIW